MDLRHLKSFLVVAEELNIGRAAVRLHISQPPLTRQIQQLEESLGAPLLVRYNRGVELTEAGRLLVEEARAILSLAEQAAERTHMAAQGKLGRIDVGIFGSGIFGVVPKILLAFREAYPSVNLVMHNLTKREQIEALRQRRLTVGFNRLVPADGDIASEVILTEGLYLAVNRKESVAKKKEISWSEIGRYPLVLFPSGSRPSFIDWVLDVCRQDGFRPEVVQEVGDAVTAVALVASGFGVCVVPESATRMTLPGVVYRPLKRNPPPRVDLSCLYRAGDDSPILRAFLDVARRFRAP
ncbi:MAG: LysR family transcriptional regulator [Rhodocyclaceae bacterium]|nr:LysR family transcriptional regulator [Rhodocyclaceae bacterium]